MLDYVALGILIFAAVVLFYGVIAIHDIPYEIAVHRKHPQQDAIHVAWMRQNSQLRLSVGDEAEIAFDGIPGEVFEAKVKMVLPVIAGGQVQPGGNLIGFTGSPPPGRVPVVLEVTDPEFAQYRDLMPGGAYGQAALYSEHLHHVAIMRKILLRMASWMNYIFPFH